MTGLHLAAYFGSVPNTGSNNPIPAVNDGILTRTTALNYVIPQKAEIVASAGFGLSMSRLRLNTPRYRTVGLPSFVGINQSVTVPSPYNLVNWLDAPLTVNPVDEISIESTQAGAGAEDHLALVLFRFETRPLMPAPVYRLRGTATITAVIGAWANGTIALDQTLPAGRYAICGLRCIGANLAGARLVFPGSAFRPGCVALEAVDSIQDRSFDLRHYGSWGEFDSINLPNLEILAVGANVAQEVFLDLQYLSGPSAF